MMLTKLCYDFFELRMDDDYGFGYGLIKVGWIGRWAPTRDFLSGSLIYVVVTR